MCPHALCASFWSPFLDSSSHDLSQMQVCAEKMISDLAHWLPLMITVTIGAALGFNILAPNYHLDPAPGPFNPIPSLSLDLATGGPFMATFWALFGFYDPPSLAMGQRTTMMAPIFMWLYLMIAVVLFINLLIAMFSDSYSAISKNSDVTPLRLEMCIPRARDHYTGWLCLPPGGVKPLTRKSPPHIRVHAGRVVDVSSA